MTEQLALAQWVCIVFDLPWRETEEQRHRRLARQPRGYNMSYEHGPGPSIRELRRQLWQIARALRAEPELARHRQQLVQAAVGQLALDVMVILTPGGRRGSTPNESESMAAARRVLAQIGDLVDPGKKALREIQREIVARTGTAPRHQGDHQVWAALDEALVTLLFTVARSTLPVAVHLEQKLGETIARALNSMVRCDLLGPGHRAKTGQEVDSKGRSTGFAIERHGLGLPTPRPSTEAEDRVQVDEDLRRLESAIAEITAGAVGTPGERAVARAFIAHTGDIRAAAASLKKREPTFRVLLARARRKNPGPLDRLLDPMVWR